jgi:hypothetical protein
MKTILSILFLLSVCFVKGQTFPANVEIVSVTDTVAVNDTLVVKWKYNSTGSTYKAYIWSPIYTSTMFNYDGATIQSVTPVNGIYTFKYVITSVLGTGNAKVIANVNDKSFYIKSSVGISEYDKNAEVIKTEYYDIYGKEKPSTSEGLIIKVTTYSNGYLKKEKVIIQ